ncbi:MULTISPECIES: hypothetical protein [Alteromonadaceae]
MKSLKDMEQQQDIIKNVRNKVSAAQKAKSTPNLEFKIYVENIPQIE